MPTYLSPGVYIEDAPPSARPIAGVGTSIGGFIGVVPNNIEMPTRPGSETASYDVAPAGEPQLITSWEEFKNSFGDIRAGNKTLALAIYGFFNNGGTRCWVTRVAAAAGLNNLADALAAFEPIDEITIVAVPGATSPVQHEAIIAHCTTMKDRFAILDSIEKPASLTPEAIRGGTAGEGGTTPTGNSAYAALYFPWIQVFDPSTEPGSIINHPPSGHIAGVYARVDGERGVFKAPANEVIRGALGLERRLSKNHQEGLNPAGINAIRIFDGNIKIWGARTLGGDANSEFKYISTRRYMNFLQESIDEGTQWVVFEPNTPDLWQRITRTVEDFLLVQWQTGGLFGETPKQAFFVKCDADTNPPQLRELGQVVTEVGVAIVRPAEFVIFRIQQLTGS
ncbi:phage tail sheath family protein [Nodosilinea sp. PGN35]|uniref:phage tail sheath family protein n=1 Tax=Nodosilinea sp. PGN35 TaxID=3020489 RepID=UPI0023B23CEE|nr:phage tail sheath subtilisin-like domain-containing protein [Nodosilinea sp. TSF1-S3]MDF0367892.1 phage tail sheath subtilisin-like domain-containing protein [Nodosilinea sp. TSF1-S3]